MKKYLALFAFIIALIVPQASDAQVNKSPYSQNSFYSWTIPVGGYADSGAVHYWAGRLDTLPNTWYPTTKNYIRVGGARLSSITVDATDSSNYTIVVKSRVMSHDGGTAGAWTTILSDSGSSVSTGIPKEFSLRDFDSDLFDGVDQELMIILQETAWGNHDTQLTAYRRVFLNWVP